MCRRAVERRRKRWYKVSDAFGRASSSAAFTTNIPDTFLTRRNKFIHLNSCVTASGGLMTSTPHCEHETQRTPSVCRHRDQPQRGKNGRNLSNLNFTDLSFQGSFHIRTLAIDVHPLAHPSSSRSHTKLQNVSTSTLQANPLWPPPSSPHPSHIKIPTIQRRVLSAASSHPFRIRIPQSLSGNPNPPTNPHQVRLGQAPHNFSLQHLLGAHSGSGRGNRCPRRNQRARKRQVSELSLYHFTDTTELG
ncbi:hypothetical protein QBC40DRAFT_286564 [Triangularia verruculosa]|uniref:Uncharacterized protein n=1 Tax=Triangularia verruculosa TaxID=2587418 RepID=A0AAN6XCF2_9PEZI|nr:hypothetical protein QBC40DRAFT_286564 [Triangularia verruculosa]